MGYGIEDVSKVTRRLISTPGIKIGNSTVHIELMILFMRLIAIIQHDGNPANKFEHELTPEPTVLYHDGLPRKPNKSVLRNRPLDTIEPSTNVTAKTCVVDGGALLHKVKWLAGT